MATAGKTTIPFVGVYRWLRRDLFKITLLRVCALVLAAMAAVVYGPFLINPLVFDDFNVINGTSFIDYTFEFRPVPRWLPYATLAHTYVIADGSVFAMRLGNLMLHAACSIAVFVLLREIHWAAVDTPQDARQRESGALTVALLAAVLFAVHPVAVYGVGYLVQRTILMSTLFMLLMLIAYLRWLTTGRTALWVWSAVWYALSVFSKEHSVMAPAVALVLTLVFHRPSLALLRRLFAPFLVYAVIAAVVISMVKGVLGAAYEPYALEMIKDAQLLGVDGQRPSYALSVATQLLLYFKYLFLWIIPNPGEMSIDVRTPLATSWAAWPYGAAALAFILYPALAISMAMRGGRIGMAGWLLIYPWLMFATELSAIRVQEPFVLYRAYLWFPLLGALVALPLAGLKLRVAITAGAIMACILTPLSWNRLQSMSDTLLLWQDAAKLLVRGDEPGAGRIFYNRGTALLAKKRREEALSDLDRVVKLHPRMTAVYNTRARIHIELNQYEHALQDVNLSLSLDPKQSAAYLIRGMAYKRLGRADEALKDFRTGCKLKDMFACYVVEQSAEATGTEKR